MKFNIDTVDGGGSVLTKNGVELSLFEACNLLNKLVEKNQNLQFLIIEMLDFIKENDGVTRQEMSDWWNNKVMFMNESEIKRKAQKEYCSMSTPNTPNFAEFGTDADGKCRYCHTDIWEHISLEKASNRLITGCPVCHRSYCD